MKNRYEDALDLDSIFETTENTASTEEPVIKESSEAEEPSECEDIQEDIPNDEKAVEKDEASISKHKLIARERRAKKKEEKRRQIAKREEDNEKFKQLDKQIYPNYSKEVYAPEKPTPGTIPESAYSKILKLFATIAILAALALVAIYYI